MDSIHQSSEGIGLESQWVRNERVVEALDNNVNEWDTTDSESSSSEEEDDNESDMEHTSGGGEKTMMGR